MLYLPAGHSCVFAHTHYPPIPLIFPERAPISPNNSLFDPNNIVSGQYSISEDEFMTA